MTIFFNNMINKNEIDEIVFATYGNGRYQFIMLIILGLTQFADSFQLVLIPFLVDALHNFEEKDSPLYIKDPKNDGFLLTLSMVVFIGMLLRGYFFWSFS